MTAGRKTHFRLFWRGAYIATYYVENADSAISMHVRAMKCTRQQFTAVEV